MSWWIRFRTLIGLLAVGCVFVTGCSNGIGLGIVNRCDEAVSVTITDSPGLVAPDERPVWEIAPGARQKVGSVRDGTAAVWVGVRSETDGVSQEFRVLVDSLDRVEPTDSYRVEMELVLGGDDCSPQYPESR